MDSYNNPAASISVRKGDGDQDHNMRNFVAPNVDKNRIKDNVVFVNEPLHEAYRSCFDHAISEYNIGKKPSRQKWPDMLHPADGYLQKLQKDIAETVDKKKQKKLPKPFYEVIVQVGNMEDYGILSHPQRAQITKEILTKYMKDFQINNPRLHVFCAVLHMDEATPHLHIDYIPVARDLKQGLPVRNALTQALAQQGIHSGNTQKDNNNAVWQVQQIDKIKSLCTEHGVETKTIGGEKRANLSPDEYRAAMAKNEQQLDRAREKTDKSINRVAFGKAFVDAEKLAEERAVTDILCEQYHAGIQDLAQKKLALQEHYKDAENDLQAEKEKELRILQEAREQAENADKQRQGEVLMVKARQMIEAAKTAAETAYKEAKAQVHKETERKIEEAESRGRQLGKMEMQDKLSDLQSRAMNAEGGRDKALKDKETYQKEVARLQEELEKERQKTLEQADKYVTLITKVRNNFATLANNSKTRMDCQKYFSGTPLYEIVRWRSVNHERRPSENTRQMER